MYNRAKATSKERPSGSASGNPSGNPFRLEKLLDYIIDNQPRALMKVLYAHGALPYHYGESVRRYLKKNALAIVREEGEEGIRAILAAHPDKELMFSLYPAPSAVTSSLEEAYTGNLTSSLADSISLSPGMPNPQKLLAVLSLAFIVLVAIYTLS